MGWVLEEVWELAMVGERALCKIQRSKHYLPLH